MIPLDIEDSSWVSRVTFAAAGRAVSFPKPVGQITVNSIAALRMPARIVWVSPGRVWIESRIQAPVGSVLTVEGGFAAAFGMEAISITVEENVRKNLMYRFSDATVASWSVPASVSGKTTEVLAKLLQQNTGPRCRVFIAVQNQKLRNKLIETFDHPKFELGSALQKQSLINEPRYFNPHVVLIEDSIARDQGGALDEMIAGLSPHSAIMILGHYHGLAALKSRHPGRRIAIVKNLPRTLPELLLKRFAPVLSTTAEGIDEDAIFLLAEHEMSFAEITLPARLTGIHPIAGEVAAPVNIGNFALAQLDSPFLRRQIGRSPWIKFVSVKQETQPGAAHLTTSAEFFFADLQAADRDKVAGLMMNTLRDSLGKVQQISDLKQSNKSPFSTATRFPVAVQNDRTGNILPFSAPAPTPTLNPAPSAGSSAVAIKLDPVSAINPSPAAITQIRSEAKIETGFVSQMKPLYVEANMRDDAETEVRVKRLTKGMQERKRHQTIAFVVAIFFIAAVIWAVKMSSNEDPANAGKIWSDSFKAFKNNGTGGASQP